MKDFDPQINNLGQLRYFAVHSAICAWDTKGNVQTCLNAAMLTGMYPCNDEHLMNSIFVKELNDRFQKIAEEKEKNKKKEPININCQWITDQNKIDEINEYIKTCQRHQYLAIENYDGNYIESIPKFFSAKQNNCFYLGSIPCYYDHKKEKMHYFN